MDCQFTFAWAQFDRQAKVSKFYPEVFSDVGGPRPNTLDRSGSRSHRDNRARQPQEQRLRWPGQFRYFPFSFYLFFPLSFSLVFLPPLLSSLFWRPFSPEIYTLLNFLFVSPLFSIQNKNKNEELLPQGELLLPESSKHEIQFKEA